jgi:hypothetical protein
MSAARHQSPIIYDEAPTRGISSGAVRAQRIATTPHLHAMPKGQRQMQQEVVAPRTVALPGLPDPSRLLTTLIVIGALSIVLYFGITSLIAWTQVKMDDVKYGRPRTSQLTAFVGHNEAAGTPSHFVAMNLNRRVTVMEFPGGDVTKPVVLVGPSLFGRDQDLTVVKLETEDINGDGKPDLTVQVKDERLVYINDGATFRPITAEELAQVKQQGGR